MLQPGTIFDSRYELVRMIGRGGFAEVWLVKDTLTGLEEALKIYAPGSGMDEDGLKIFVKELIVAHDLHHPHLLTPNMLGQYERQPYLIMQYCPNGSLNKKVGKCTEDEAWQILEHVASGLAYLHAQGVVHQDIKPDNILKDAKGNYVITDFGISLRAQTTLRKSMRVQANSGTMAYMAPERFSAEPHPIPANDIWSLGAMMFELIEGNVPFGEYGGGMQKGGADIPTMHADVSDNLKQVIRSLLALNPEDRPTAAELVELIMSKRTRPISTKPDVKRGSQNEFSSKEAGEGSSLARKWVLAISITFILAVIVAAIGINMRSNRVGSDGFIPKDSHAMTDTATMADLQTDSSMVEQKSMVTPDEKQKAKPDDVLEKEQRQRKEEEEARKVAEEVRKAEAVRQEAARRAEETRKAEEARKVAEEVSKIKSQQGWIDLGLRSGTLWNAQNEDGLYSHDEAVAKFGNSLPTKEQIEELKSSCRWTWVGKGYKVKGPNGNHIYMPAAGYRDGSGNVSSVGVYGRYWSSTSDDAGRGKRWYWYLGISPKEVIIHTNFFSGGQSVRLVR